MLFQTNTLNNLKFYKFMRYAASKKVSRFAPLSPKVNAIKVKNEHSHYCQMSMTKAAWT